jgi:DNA-binding MarR family transcriptional regulator
MHHADSSKNPSEAAAEKLLAFRVLSLGQLLNRGIAVLLDKHLGLSVRQWRVLFYLANSGPDSAQNIADFCRYDKSQVSRAIAELLQKKMVRTTASTTDGRRQVVSLTATGRTSYQRGLPLSQSRHTHLVECLSAQELKDFERTMDKLMDRAQDLLDQADTEKAAVPAGKAPARSRPARPRA